MAGISTTSYGRNPTLNHRGLTFSICLAWSSVTPKGADREPLYWSLWQQKELVWCVWWLTHCTHIFRNINTSSATGVPPHLPSFINSFHSLFYKLRFLLQIPFSHPLHQPIHPSLLLSAPSLWHILYVSISPGSGLVPGLQALVAHWQGPAPKPDPLFYLWPSSHTEHEQCHLGGSNRCTEKHVLTGRDGGGSKRGRKWGRRAASRVSTITPNRPIQANQQ